MFVSHPRKKPPRLSRNSSVKRTLSSQRRVNRGNLISVNRLAILIVQFVKDLLTPLIKQLQRQLQNSTEKLNRLSQHQQSKHTLNQSKLDTLKKECEGVTESRSVAQKKADDHEKMSLEIAKKVCPIFSFVQSVQLLNIRISDARLEQSNGVGSLGSLRGL